jgi:hypothetical protein
MDTSNQLGQDAEAEVPTVVPCPPDPQISRDLANVKTAWNHLPDAIRAAILALIQTTGGANG